MNRIELAAERCELEPLTVDPAVTPVSIALWGLFLAAAGIAYVVGYNLHGGVGTLEDAVQLDESIMDAPTIGELLAARQDA